MSVDDNVSFDAKADTALAERPTPRTKGKRKVDPDKRANRLEGKAWLKNSISVWGDIAKTKEEKAIKHPASFPEALVSRLLESFLNKPGQTILDPFLGVGSTLAAACESGHTGIGFELYPEAAAIARDRLAPFDGRFTVFNESAFRMGELLRPGHADMVITSPPYWNILNRRRTADYKDMRHYGTKAVDLGNIDDYDEFLDQLVNVMRAVHTALRSEAYCVINVMDIRVKSRLYTLHSDLYTRLETIGFKLDDIVIWDRRAEYNNLRPLGYPCKFRINRVHEYLLIFQKVT